MLLPERQIDCPYCGETITVLIDDNEEDSYVEDCQVCCRPLVLQVVRDGDDVDIWVRREDE